MTHTAEHLTPWAAIDTHAHHGHVHRAEDGQGRQPGGAPSRHCAAVSGLRQVAGNGTSSEHSCVTNSPLDTTGQSGGHDSAPGRSATALASTRRRLLGNMFRRDTVG